MYAKKTLNCEKCGIEFSSKQKTPRFCSKPCATSFNRMGKSPWNKGKPYLQITGEKHPRWNRNRAKCMDCQKPFSKATVSSKRCIKCSGRMRRGTNSPFWKGDLRKGALDKCKDCGEKVSRSSKGKTIRCRVCWLRLRAERSIQTEVKRIRQSGEYYKWKKAVLEKDGHKCRMCESVERIEVDHIMPFWFLIEYNHFNLLFKVENGRTLCHDCHVKHTDYALKRIRTPYDRLFREVFSSR